MARQLSKPAVLDIQTPVDVDISYMNKEKYLDATFDFD